MLGKVIVGSFGERDGVHMYRVNGEKPDLLRIIEEMKEVGDVFDEEPILEPTFNRQYSVLLKIKVPVPSNL